MSRRREGDPAQAKGAVDERWWVDSERKRGADAKKPAGPVGSRLFAVGNGYDQDRALENLTDLNLRLLQAAAPAPGQWAYLALAEGRCPEQKLGRVRKQLALPSYACGVMVDSDGLLRLLVTGTSVGERIMEMTLGKQPSFDCWIDGEWVGEDVFQNEQEGFAALRKLVRHYLSPAEGGGHGHGTHAQP